MICKLQIYTYYLPLKFDTFTSQESQLLFPQIHTSYINYNYNDDQDLYFAYLDDCRQIYTALIGAQKLLELAAWNGTSEICNSQKSSAIKKKRAEEKG